MIKCKQYRVIEASELRWKCGYKNGDIINVMSTDSVKLTGVDHTGACVVSWSDIVKGVVEGV